MHLWLSREGLYRWKKVEAHFSGEKLLVGEKITSEKLVTKFYTSPVSQKSLFIFLKLYFKNRKLINGQVNWFIKINFNVEVFFFFTTAVSVTDQF